MIDPVCALRVIRPPNVTCCPSLVHVYVSGGYPDTSNTRVPVWPICRVCFKLTPTILSFQKDKNNIVNTAGPQVFIRIIGTLQSDNGDTNENIAAKIDFASFETFLPLYQVTQLLEGRVVRLELKRGNRVGVQREIVKFIALPFLFSRQLKIWSFHVVGKKMYKKAGSMCRVIVLLIKNYRVFDIPIAVATVVS